MDPILVGFVVYLMVVLVVGVIAFRKTKSQAGFILGDRKLGPWVIAFSERASGESAWLLVGLPGAALAFGFIEHIRLGGVRILQRRVGVEPRSYFGAIGRFFG